ncbi:MAG: serine hydrolase, partial [Bacteroidota bacterium]
MKAFTVLIPILMISSAASQTLDDARSEIEKLVHSSAGTFAVAVEDLSTGKQLLMNEREMFHAASTMKTPVMIEVFKQAHEGSLHLDDSVVVRNQFRSIIDGSNYSLDLGDDSDDSIYRRIGQNASIRELVYHMITVSS